MTRGFQAFLGVLGQALLLLVGIEDGTAVLRAPVRELAPGIRGIYVPPKHLEQLLVGNLVRIINHLDSLDVPGTASGNLTVGGVGLTTAGVARDGLEHAVDLFKIRFRAPKTAAGKDSRLSLLGFIVHLFLHISIHASYLVVAQ